ncbi:ISXO2-like domain-containing protein [Vairimorpha necatrix]|uniref:ISXO2-like domain-containing protein n=1 Tax=Vairimorpha necatrix TaxID=6039 RepID=A0AAX4JFY5_9MICR
MKSQEEKLFEIFLKYIEKTSKSCIKCGSISKKYNENFIFRSIAEFLGISIKSVRKIISLTVNSIENSVYVETGIIGGPGIVVEIDEKGVWIFGMVERTPQRKIVFVPVDNRRATTLEELLKKIC